MNNKICRAACAALVSAALAACGGGGDSDNGANAGTPGTTTPPPRTDGNPTPDAAPTAALVDNAATATALAEGSQGRHRCGPQALSGTCRHQPVRGTCGCDDDHQLHGGRHHHLRLPGHHCHWHHLHLQLQQLFVCHGLRHQRQLRDQVRQLQQRHQFCVDQSLTTSISRAPPTTATAAASRAAMWVAWPAAPSARAAAPSNRASSTRTACSTAATSGLTAPTARSGTYSPNWGATSGTIQVTGANGNSATIVRNSATSFTITINGGTPRIVTG